MVAVVELYVDGYDCDTLFLGHRPRLYSIGVVCQYRHPEFWCVVTNSVLYG
jgi:hypothetical protein